MDFAKTVDRDKDRMRGIASTTVFAVCLAGCAAHEVYEKAGLNEANARADWAECEKAALAATGVAAKDVGGASVRGDRLLGEVINPEKSDGGMYKPADYLAIKHRQQMRKDCLNAKGYHFLGVPSVEML